MRDFPPNINSRLAVIIATTLGFLIMDDFDATEQVAIGNWIVQVGQTIITNATYQQMVQSRIIGSERINLNSREFKCGGDPFIFRACDMNSRDLYDNLKSIVTDEEIVYLQKALKVLSEEMDKLKKEFNETS